MATLSTNYKYSLRYAATYSGDNSSRTLSGLNIAGGQSYPNSGPNRDTAIGTIVTTLTGFTNATLGSWKWLTETEVIL